MELQKLLNQVLLLLKDNVDSDYSNQSVYELQKILSMQIKAIEDNSIIDSQELILIFLPTSTLQETAMTNEWSSEYLVLAEKFDNLIKHYS